MTTVAGVARVTTQPRAPRGELWIAAGRRLARNRLAVAGGALVAIFVVIALLAPVLAPYPYDAQIFPRNAPPSAQNWLGTDDLGRDLLSRLIYGARISLIVGLATQGIVLVIGLLVGCVSGYLGRWIDTSIMRFTDIMFAFPTLLFAIVLLSVFGRELTNVFLAISLSMWPNMARLVRSAVLNIRDVEFVEAARALGARDQRIITSHIVPNILGTVIVACTFGVPAAIMSEAFLSFVGLGVRPPTPSWGLMVSEGFPWIRSNPMLALLPGIAISTTLFAFNFLGDGLRDALDPKMTR